jgi:hypothetical protein
MICYRSGHWSLFLLTKHPILTLKILGTTAAILLPIFLASSIRPFSGDLTCVDEYSEEIYHIARVVQREAGGESKEGKLAIISALRNGAHGYKVGKLRPELVELAAKEIKKPVRHQYKHWINLKLATDRRQILIAKKALRDKKGVWVDSQWFY